MPDKFELGDELDAHDIALFLIGAIGATVETYVEQEYCDPALYNLVDFAESLSVHLNFPEMTERLAFLKMRAGETVNDYIDKHDLPVSKDGWSK